MAGQGPLARFLVLLRFGLSLADCIGYAVVAFHSSIGDQMGRFGKYFLQRASSELIYQLSPSQRAPSPA